MRFYCLALILILTAVRGNAQEVCYNPNLVRDTTKKSIKSMTVAMVAGDSIKIEYHSPGVRNRVIWGGLVPYAEVWVTGGHDATAITFTKTVSIEGTVIPPGKYAFFSIPGKKGWTLILNRRWKQHLASEYDEQEDLVRVRVQPKKIKYLERLQYFIESKGTKEGKIAVAWERIRVELPFSIVE